MSSPPRASAYLGAALIDAETASVRLNMAILTHQWVFSRILAPHGVALTSEMFDKVVVGNNNETIMRTLIVR